MVLDPPRVNSVVRTWKQLAASVGALAPPVYLLVGELAQVPHYPETRASPGGYLHRAWGVSGAYLHRAWSFVEVWEFKLYFYPSAGGFCKKLKNASCEYDRLNG